MITIYIFNSNRLVRSELYPNQLEAEERAKFVMQLGFTVLFSEVTK